MNITIIGHNDGLEGEIYENLIKFVAERFFHRNTIRVLDITLEFSEADLVSRGQHAHAFIHPDDKRRNPRCYVIKIDPNMKLWHRLVSLAPEMVHVKQWVLREMIDDLRFKKQDVVFFHSKKYHVNELNYYDLPWEIEAHGRERGLLALFGDRYGYDEEPWYETF